MENKSGIVERIKGELKSKGIKPGEFFKLAEIKSKSQSFGNWSKQKSTPAADTAIKMAEFLNVSVKWLITGIGDKSSGLTDDEHNLLKVYDQLNSDGKKAALRIIRGLVTDFPLSSEQDGASTGTAT